MPTAQKEVAVGHRLLEQIVDARRKSDALFDIVKPEAIFERPIPERHRIIFYVGHLEAFDWNLLHENIFGLKSFYPEFDRLFAFGIDPVGGGLPSDQPSDWPSLQKVRDYVRRIRESLDQKLSIAALDSKSSGGFSLETLMHVAIEHRLMHVETLAYMLHQLPLERKIRQNVSTPLLTSAVEDDTIPVPAGAATLGLSRASGTFGWDNEFERHRVDVPAFEIDKYMVSNRQFLEFVDEGGYETRSLWSEDDWNWKTANGVSHPVFWKKRENVWFQRTMFDEIPLRSTWPVYVSHAEASAFARWSGRKLPTEAQWHRAAYGSPDDVERTYPWGRYAPDSSLGNFDFAHWDPTPVNAHSLGQSAFGVEGLLGNGWEWTSTVFAPFPGFEPFPFYRGYSADFFDGKHFVMKGGSARTAACMLRPTFRNWFQSHYQYVYAGFRCVNS
ncbi:MAG TPA: SUMF1/EgtB/PvdO family nonheme iron enzyme [Candidatus Sulfotelmatobacter sp.]|nr:SUMF1/EgtB/PvdO family nonheme iron enzyme [Candidatus Sulfotelmatobacter sp.]